MESHWLLIIVQYLHCHKPANSIILYKGTVPCASKTYKKTVPTYSWVRQWKTTKDHGISRFSCTKGWGIMDHASDSIFVFSMIISQNHHYNYQPKRILTVQLSPMNMISNWMANREKVCATELNMISMSWHQTGNKLLVPSAHQLLNRSKLASKYNSQKNKDSSIYAKIVFSAR